jgi:hypothetical protein
MLKALNPLAFLKTLFQEATASKDNQIVSRNEKIEISILNNSTQTKFLNPARKIDFPYSKLKSSRFRDLGRARTD